MRILKYLNLVKLYVAVLIFIIASLVMASLYGFAVYFYFTKILPIDSYATDKFGQFGDFVGGICNPILGFLTLVGIILSLIYQKNQILISKSDAIRAEFYEMAGLLSEIIDKIGPRDQSDAFEWLSNEFKLRVSLLAVGRFKSRRLDECLSESTLQLIVDNVMDSNLINEIPQGKIHCEKSVKSKFNIVLAEIGFNGIVPAIENNKNILLIVANDYLEAVDTDEVSKIFIHGARKTLIASNFAFGPFVKTVIRMVETCQKFENLNRENNFWSDLKSQLNSYQMVALMINAIAGKLNRNHDIQLRNHSILNDICLLDDPFLDKAVQIYEEAEIVYPK